jgi:hypothetical protein
VLRQKERGHGEGRGTRDGERRDVRY